MHLKPLCRAGTDCLGKNEIDRHCLNPCRFSGCIAACDNTVSTPVHGIAHRFFDQRMIHLFHVYRSFRMKLRLSIKRKTFPKRCNTDCRIQAPDLFKQLQITLSFVLQPFHTLFIRYKLPECNPEQVIQKHPLIAGIAVSPHSRHLSDQLIQFSQFF